MLQKRNDKSHVHSVPVEIVKKTNSTEEKGRDDMIDTTGFKALYQSGK